MILPLLALAQAGFTYSDNDGAFSLQAQRGFFSQVANGFRFDLSKGVNLDSKTKKLTLSASQVTAMVVRSKGAKDPDSLQSARATGNVKVTQSTGGTTANLQSQSATYTAQGEGGIVQAKGSVRILNVDTTKKQTLVATGSSGSANLNSKAKRGISRALLNGPVRVEVVKSGRKAAKIIFTGNKLTIDGNVIKLMGNVKATGTGDSGFGTLSHADVMTGYLTDSGELKDFSFASGTDQSLSASIEPFAPQGRLVYEDPTKSLRALNATSWEGTSLENGNFEFRMVGNPAIVEARLQGMTIKAPSLSGIFAPPPTGQPAGYIEKLDVTGGSTVVFDSLVKFQTELEHSKKFGTPVPVARVGKDVSTLKSDRLTYTGTAAAGTFTIPEAFTIDMDSTGQRLGKGKPAAPGEPAPQITKDFHMVANFAGISGKVQLNPSAKELGMLQSGNILGPVTATITQTETSAALPDAEISNVKVTADRIDFDMVKDQTITLTGAVRVEGNGNAYRGTSEGDLAVMTVDPKTLQIQKIRITGDPTKSTYQEKKPVKKGGGR